MSELSDFRKKVLSHQVVFEGIPLAYQLGIPNLHVERGQLCVSFFPHKVNVKDSQWEWDYPDFQMICLYPSCKIVYFANMNYRNTAAHRESGSKITTEIRSCEPQLRKLEAMCSNAMRAWAEQKDCEKVINFENARKQVADHWGLSALWGE